MTLYGIRARRVATMDLERATVDSPLGIVTSGVVVFDQTRVVFVGNEKGAPAGVSWAPFEADLITPGLVDAHTHACWAGSRHDEYALRMAGGDYRAIAKAGGGIRATYRAIRDATEDELTLSLASRLRRMAALGATCIEVKSGYGLEPDIERKQLRAIARVGKLVGLPKVVPTYLALHALPAADTPRDDYVHRAAHDVVPSVAHEGLARFVDAYVDQNAFTAAEAREVCGAARHHGLGVRLHVGQFADVGGVELGVDVGASSLDHLEHVSDRGLAAMARAQVTAMLLPVATFTLNDHRPNVEAMRKAGVTMAVASDANPGTAPTESLPLAMAFAVRAYGLTPSETWRGATVHAARSLGESQRGSLVEGAYADLVVWDLPHEDALLQPWGTPKTNLVIREGVAISSTDAVYTDWLTR